MALENFNFTPKYGQESFEERLKKLLMQNVPLGQGGIQPITGSSLRSNPLYNGDTIKLDGSPVGAPTIGSPLFNNQDSSKLLNLPKLELPEPPEVTKTNVKDDTEDSQEKPSKFSLLGNKALQGAGNLAQGAQMLGSMTGNTTISNIGNLVQSGKGIADAIKNFKAVGGGVEGWGGIAGAAGSAASVARSFFQNQHANDSALTSGLNQGYNAISDAMMGFSPVGTIIGGAMKVGGLVGDLAKSFGGGTDQMTTTDQIMDSDFLSWNVGLINGFGGSRADTFGVNKEVLAGVGADYGGSSRFIQDAAKLSGKKYGLFSGGARREANHKMGQARVQQNIMSRINDSSRDQKEIASSMSSLNSLRYIQQLNGGIDNYALAAQLGTKLQRVRNIVKHTEEPDTLRVKRVVANINIPFQLPEFKTYDELIGYLKKTGRDSDEQYDLKAAYNDPEVYKQWRETELKNPGKGHWLDKYKKPNHPTFSTESVYSNEKTTGGQWKKLADGTWQFTVSPYLMSLYSYDDYINYFKDEPGNTVIYGNKKHVSKHQNGGVIEDDWQPILEEVPQEIESFKQGGTIDEDDWIPTITEVLIFKEGGNVKEEESETLTPQKNVIPEGALHKNKHNMENADGLTKKGIPVIDNEGEQQAEIELNEIIFSLEVTKKLESLYDSYKHYDTSNKEKDELAIEAGKLLVQEILFNTEDRTGLIDSLKNGGKINGSTE